MVTERRCPKCGGEITFGFGLAGGGYGPYWLCLTDDCDFFEKTQAEREPNDGEREKE